mgnify:CR=1 FL=1
MRKVLFSRISEAIEVVLPNLKVGDALTLKELEPMQHFTKPPARYTEASLIKELEEPPTASVQVHLRAGQTLTPAQVAGVALLTDYILTVAVSVSAGVAALYSAFGALKPYAVPIALGFIAVIASGGSAATCSALRPPTATGGSAATCDGFISVSASAGNAATCVGFI